MQTHRRCGHAPGTVHPEDRAVIDAFRSMLAALRTPRISEVSLSVPI
ncbi:hypothetical protein ACIQIG_33930 [Streptomyces bacillaris]